MEKTLTFSTGLGEDLTIQSLHWGQVWNLRGHWDKVDTNFINAWVTSNIPKTRGLCDHGMTRSTYFRDIQVLPPHEDKKVECENKVDFENYCKEIGVKGDKIRNCVIDLCNAMTKEQVLKIVEKNREHKKDVCRVERTNVRACSIFADPHVTPFSGAMYNAQVLGDWVAYGGFNLEAHYTGNSHGSWVGVMKYGVELYGHKIESIGFDVGSLKIDGHVRSTAQKIHLSHGTITRSGNSLSFNTNDGEEVTFTAYGYFYNILVRSNIKNTRGLCAHSFLKSAFHKNPQEGEFKEIEARHCHKKFHFRRFCQKHKLHGGELHSCITDLCSGMKKRAMLGILHKNHRGFRRPLFIHGRRFRPVLRIFRPVTRFVEFRIARGIRFIGHHHRHHHRHHLRHHLRHHHHHHHHHQNERRREERREVRREVRREERREHHVERRQENRRRR